jgi:thiosulfate/3-mercaptopyruvate sulfurtransferase
MSYLVCYSLQTAMTTPRLFRIMTFAAFFLASSASLAGEPPSGEQLARGKTLYAIQCAGCHGDDGEDISRGENTKTLPGIYIRRNDFEIGHRFRGLLAALITEAERTDLVAYVRSLKGKKSHARPEMLISPTALKPFVPDPGVRIVDLRPADQYARSHIPNAVRLDPFALWPAPDPETFARLMMSIGVGDSVYVVAYDDDGGRSASLFWALLQDYGHERVSALDGGWRVWTTEKGYITPWKPSRRSVTFTPRPRSFTFIAEHRTPDARIRIIDAGDHASGLSGRLHIPWSASLSSDGGFLPASDLMAVYGRVSGDMRHPTLVTSRRPAEAAQSLFALRLIGFTDVRMTPENAIEVSLHQGRP